MATSIGSLVVSLTAETAQFRADLNRATSDVSRFVQGAKAIGAATAFAAAITGLTVMAKRAIETVDALDKMATRVGVGAERLQELQYAASQSGVGVSELETALTRLNQKIAEAATAGGQSKQFFEGIGIAIRASNGAIRDAGEILPELADRVQNAGSAVERARIQYEAFGRTGNALTPMLIEGSAGLARFAEQARRLGIVMDAAMIREGVKAKDALETLSKVVSMNLARAVVAVAPQIAALSRALAEAAAQAGHFFEILQEPHGETATAALLAREVENLARLKRELASMQSGIGGAINRFFGQEAQTQAAITRSEEAIANYRKQLRAFVSERAEANKAAAAKGVVVGELGAIGPDLTKDIESFRKQLLMLSIPDDLTRKLVEIRLEVEKFSGTKYAAEAKKIGDALERLTRQAAEEKEIEAKLDAIEQGFITIEGVSRRVSDIAKEQAPFAEAFGGELKPPDTKRFQEALADLQRQINELDMSPLEKEISETLRGVGPDLTQPQRDALTALITTLYQARTAKQADAAALEEFDRKYKASQESIDRYNKSLQDQGEAIRRSVIAPSETHAATLEILRGLYDRGAISVETYYRALDKANETLRSATTGPGEDMIESLNRQIAAFQMTGREAATYNAYMEALKTSTPEAAQRIRELTGTLYDLQQKQREATQYQEDLKNVVVNTSLQISDTFLDWALTGKVSFKDLADSIIRDMGRIITKMLILKAIEVTIKALGGATGYSADYSAAFSSGYNQDVYPMAKGGVVKARPGGRLIIAGEAGSDEAIIPLDRMGQLGGSARVTVINQIENNNGSQVTTRQQQRPDGTLINRIIINSVKDGLASGEFDDVGKNLGWRRQGVSR